MKKSTETKEHPKVPKNEFDKVLGKMLKAKPQKRGK